MLDSRSRKQTEKALQALAEFQTDSASPASGPPVTPLQSPAQTKPVELTPIKTGTSATGPITTQLRSPAQIKTSQKSPVKGKAKRVAYSPRYDVSYLLFVCLTCSFLAQRLAHLSLLSTFGRAIWCQLFNIVADLTMTIPRWVVSSYLTIMYQKRLLLGLRKSFRLR